MKPRPKLQRVPVCEWVIVNGVSLTTDLDLWLKAKLVGEGDLPGEILEEAGDGSRRLPVRRRNSRQKQPNQSYEEQILESYVWRRHRSSLKIQIQFESESAEERRIRAAVVLPQIVGFQHHVLADRELRA